MTRSQGAHAGSRKMPSRTARRGNEGWGVDPWVDIPFSPPRIVTSTQHVQHKPDQRRCRYEIVNPASLAIFFNRPPCNRRPSHPLCIRTSQTNERHHDQLTLRPRSQTQTKSSRQSAIDRDLGKDNHRRRRTPSRHTPLHRTSTSDR
jgi:hypothetical protein